MEFLEGKFTVEKTHTFNLYYLLTRVFINMFAKFEGYGRKAVKDDIVDVADTAARRLYELMGDRIKISVDKGESFVPIQGFVLRRAAQQDWRRSSLCSHPHSPASGQACSQTF